MTDKNNNHDTKFAWRLWLGISLYLLCNACLQLLVSPTADLDQSEQLMLSQVLLPGYTSQPPLYTWLVYAIFQFTGPSLAALLFLKVTLLSTITGALLKTGHLLKFSRQQYLITATGLALIPQFIWESQRDLTHSTLVTALAALSLMQLIRLKQQPAMRNYMLMGLLIGLGMLSKYNYSFFALALLLAGLSVAVYRKALLNWRTATGLFIALLIFSPHGYWAINHMDIASESVQKLNISDTTTVQGLLAPLLKAATFLAPFWLFALFLYYTNRGQSPLPTSEKKLLLRILFYVGLIVVLFAIIVGAQSFKDRWYQPLLFFTPVLLACYLPPKLKGKLSVTFLGSALLLAILAALLLPGRVILAEKTDKISRPNYPYSPLSQILIESLEKKPATILAENRLLGGNLRLNFPKALILSPDNYRVNPTSISAPVLIICEAKQCTAPEFAQWSLNFINAFPSPKSLTEISIPFLYSPRKNHTIYTDWVEKK